MRDRRRRRLQRQERTCEPHCVLLCRAVHDIAVWQQTNDEKVSDLSPPEMALWVHLTHRQHTHTIYIDMMNK